jgi:hypothetical protein
VLVVFILQRGDQGHLAPAAVDDLLVLESSLELRHEGCLLLLVGSSGIEQQAVLGEGSQQSAGTAYLWSGITGLVVISSASDLHLHLLRLHLLYFLEQDPGHLFEGVLPVGLLVVFGFGPPDGARVLAQVLLKLLDFVLLLLVVVGVDAFSDQLGTLQVVQHRAHLLDRHSLLLPFLGQPVLQRVLAAGVVGDVLDEVLPPEELVVMVVPHPLVVGCCLFTPTHSRFLQVQAGVPVHFGSVSEEFLDAAFSFGLRVEEADASDGQGKHLSQLIMPIIPCPNNPRASLTASTVDQSLLCGPKGQIGVTMLIEYQLLPLQDIPPRYHKQLGAVMVLDVTVAPLRPELPLLVDWVHKQPLR